MRNYGDNLGGIRRAWIGAITLAGSWPSLSLISNAISQAQLDALTELPLYPYRAGFYSTPGDGEQGLSFSQSFDTGIPSDSEETFNLIEQYLGIPVMLIYMDIDGKYWMAFDIGNPGKFMSDFASGVNPNDGKLHTLKISNIIALNRVPLTLTV